jgi:uncharacterized membrane protein
MTELIERWTLGSGSGAFNDWRWISTNTLPAGWLIAIALLIAAALIVSVARLQVKRRGVLIVLRTLGALAVIGAVVMPAIELRAVSKVRSRVALVVDASRSMSMATPSGTRAERVSQHLADNSGELARLGREAVLERALFGTRLTPVEELPSPLPAKESKSDLARALGDLARESSGRELGAVLLYSDGADTEGLTPERARALAAEVGAPIYAVGFSADEVTADLAVRRVFGDDFAFVHNTVTLDVELEQRGLELSTVPVTLKRDGNVVATKEVSFDAAGRATATFEFKPNRIGKIAYQVSVPVMPKEAVASNNARSFVLKVIRDRIRILQVAGRPSWDERFLRELLKRNPNIDLISFFILRSTTDLQKASPEELALIPFPVNDLFTKELGSFDVVIYQNFTYRPYKMAHYLPNLQEYVLRGGSFLMIGGNESFEDGWYSGTAISDILPVRLGGAPPYDHAEFRPRLTKEGRRHPISLIGEPGEPPESVFQRLPALFGVNPTLGLAPGAQALLVHPSLPGNPPVVAIREVGEGRTMAVTTDSLWSWRFVAVGEGSAGREFDRFWNSALRWLIRDPELARVRIRSDRAVHQLGESITGEVRVLASDYRGLPDADVELELVRVDQPAPPKPLPPVRTGPEGNAPVVIPPVEPGTYLLKASARSAEERVGRAEEPIVVEAVDAELSAPFPRPEMMAALAEGSGGRFIDISDGLGELEIKESRRVEVDRTRVVPVWDSFPALVLLVVVFSLEWFLRRRSGLL